MTPNVDKVDNKRTTKKVAKETTIVLIINCVKDDVKCRLKDAKTSLKVTPIDADKWR